MGDPPINDGLYGEVGASSLDDRLWVQLSKATLDVKMESCYKKLEDIRSVEDFGMSLKTNLKIKTKSERIALKRLDDMFKDPQFGPDFFLKEAKLIRRCLREYKLCKNNPEDFGRFFHCSSPSSQIILHFNSVTGKKEIFVLLPSGEKPRQKPVKVEVSTIIRWHQNRKVKAYKAQMKEIRTMLVLREDLRKVIHDFRTALTSTEWIHGRFHSFLQDLSKKLQSINIQTRCTAGKKLLFEKAQEKFREFRIIGDEVMKRKADFDSLNPRMFDERDFIRMTIDHYKSLTKYFENQGELLETFLAIHDCSYTA